MKARELKIGFVPTMGYLHEGHSSLIDKARQENGAVVVSIFVNPKQFGPQEDLSNYPRDLTRDSSLCEKHGADLIYLPSEDVMYPEGYSTYVEVEGLSGILCGASRPGHFKGVATVVLKLFNLVSPDRAYFGLKDFQQFRVIRRMALDLNLPVEVLGCPIVREKDGLAMSSRNVYLSREQRAKAGLIHQSLKEARNLIGNGETSGERVISMMGKMISGIPDSRLDYIKICHPETLESIAEIKEKVVILVACHVGRARLIDNLTVETA
ncbi:MAG: pantoate--beta-alanine ligase [Candidatus Wallbacteria bacterium]|nr:pantoate--beta-alanine ligase [Candidatus Wallbacteria bacterium]